MTREELERMTNYNLEFMEAELSEQLFGGDYTSAVELKYTEKYVDDLEQQIDELQNVRRMLEKIISELKEENEELRGQTKNE